MPKVTVLIPAKNAATTLEETLESLCAQSFHDFDVCLIDDGSTDNTAEIGGKFSARLALKVIHLDSSVGVAGALNTGLSTVTSDYIARLDADDTALPARLLRQVQFMDAHPEIEVCGTAMEMFWEDGSQPARFLVKPSEDTEIRTALVQYCSLSHPSVMVRRVFFDRVGVYDPNFDFAEDYELWCRGALKGAKYANLSEPLTRYRQHNKRVSVEKQALQSERALEVQRRYISALLGEPAGLLPELLSLGIQFRSREVFEQVLRQEMGRMSMLSRAAPCGKTIADIAIRSVNKL